MNTVAKGNRVEIEAKKELESEGWIVERKTRARFQSPDFFGLFDLIAIKGNKCRLIQIKSHISGFYMARKAIKAFKMRSGVMLSMEVWLKLHPDKEQTLKWRKETITASETPSDKTSSPRK